GGVASGVRGGHDNRVRSVIAVIVGPTPSSTDRANLGNRSLIDAERYRIVVVGEVTCIGSGLTLVRRHIGADGGNGGRNVLECNSKGSCSRRAVGIGGSDDDIVGMILISSSRPVPASILRAVLCDRAGGGSERYGIVVIGEGAAVVGRCIFRRTDG